VAAVVAVFVVAGGGLILRTVGGGGRDVTLDVTVTGSTMSPPDLAVKQGDHVTMNVTTDKAEEIHLHEYDIKFAGEPARKITHTFTADKTGEHSIEIEDTGTEIGKLTVNP
jgi:heme/copper-type cytochrome/quinol oxidase subunit 2